MCLVAGENQFRKTLFKQLRKQSLQEVCNSYLSRDFEFHSKLQVQIQRRQKF